MHSIEATSRFVFTSYISSWCWQSQMSSLQDSIKAFNKIVQMKIIFCWIRIKLFKDRCILRNVNLLTQYWTACEVMRWGWGCWYLWGQPILLKLLWSWVWIPLQCQTIYEFAGKSWCHSSMIRLTYNLRPRVRIPTTLSMLLTICIQNCVLLFWHCFGKRTRINQKEPVLVSTF